MMRSAAEAVVAVILAMGVVACTYTTIDYIDLVQHDGVQYVASLRPTGRPLTDADLGPEQFRVRQMLSGGGSAASYRAVDGDAAFVPAGTPVYAMRGYSPRFRLVARHDDRLVLYEADTSSGARVGSDILDIQGRVRAIAVLSGSGTMIGRVDDAASVRDLVELVAVAPVDQSVPIEGAAAVLVTFELTDGTATSRPYFMKAGVLQRGINVGGAFRDTVNKLIAGAATPTPRPGPINPYRRYDPT